MSQLAAASCIAASGATVLSVFTSQTLADIVFMEFGWSVSIGCDLFVG